jgi:predicted ATPase
VLTRLKVKGFKNLIDLDVRFGPFTCIAGANGAGKSNLFDAILLLSRLADQGLLEAITSVRGETRSSEAARIFSRVRGTDVAELSLEADMLVPAEAFDDLDQPAKASITGLRYAVAIQLRRVEGSLVPKLELVREQLDYIKRGDAAKVFPFARRKKTWLDSAFMGRRTSALISTEDTQDGHLVKVHEDSGHQGRTRTLRAEGLTRTVLSTMNTAESPTALVARRELQSWRLLQLEPSRLRSPDELKAAGRIDETGSGLAATVNRIFSQAGADQASVRAQLTNRLAELVESVRDVRVDVDDKRELITLLARGVDGIEHRARDLSDGTLRFLALAVLELDRSWRGTLCLEEPENGIHPTRIPAILDLLQSLATDLDEKVDEFNPLRQVIINTHSPEVAALVPPDSLLVARPRPVESGGLQLNPLSGTWRDVDEVEVVAPGTVLEMLHSARAAIEKAHQEKRDVVGTRPELGEQYILDINLEPPPRV